MKNNLKFFAYILLLINSVGALYGGWNLMVNPDGESLNLPIEFLEHTPFLDYFIPGIILFLSNGVFGIAVIIAMYNRTKNYSSLIMFQGILLLGYILTEIVLIKTFSPLQLIAGVIGITLMILSYMLIKLRDNRRGKQKSMSDLNVSQNQ
ncbi:MAG: hypothetical protein JNJ58_10785 [Chitinophagaceae bacterium]|nr:hypothetical protein [Chitinophagaceae bacterium]